LEPDSLNPKSNALLHQVFKLEGVNVAITTKWSFSWVYLFYRLEKKAFCNNIKTREGFQLAVCFYSFIFLMHRKTERMLVGQQREVGVVAVKN